MDSSFAPPEDVDMDSNEHKEEAWWGRFDLVGDPPPLSSGGPSASTRSEPGMVPCGTQNEGDHNETYNSSHVYREQKYDRRSHSNAVVHVHVHQRANSPLSSPSHTHVTPDRSQDSLYNPLPTPPTSDSDLSPRPGITGDEEQTRTRSHIYELLLLQCGLGFPLWMPSPRCTPDGEYELDIGDVGVFPANKDGIPEGVDPPCPLASRWFTIKKGYHPPETVLIRPARAISKQEAHAGAGFNVFTFRLSAEGGALLMLPQGGTLKKLEKTASFKERLRFHWRQWYDFAQGQVDLDDGQALYLVTGVERCATWAMASWDAVPNVACDELESLELTVDDTTGACSWAFPPVRCSTQSSDPPATANNPQSGPRETVFVRGFRIDRFDGSINQRPPGFSSQPGKGKDDNSDGHSNSRGGSSRDLSSFGDSSNLTFPTRYSCSGGGSSGASNPQSDSPDPLIDTTQIMELDLNRSDNEGVSVTHPCEVINKFAFELMSHMKPALDTGCVAFSHDDDWISILQDSDKGIPLETEIIRRICSQFKFAIGGNTIFTVSMTDLDKELLEKREAPSLQGLGDSIPVLLEFWAEDNVADDLSPGVLLSRSSVDYGTRDTGVELRSHKQDDAIHSRSPNMSDTATEPTEEPAWRRTLSAMGRRSPQYFCNVPGCTSQGFTQKHNLQYHLRSHLGMRSFECSCSRTFHSRSDLNRHARRTGHNAQPSESSTGHPIHDSVTRMPVETRISTRHSTPGSSFCSSDAQAIRVKMPSSAAATSLVSVSQQPERNHTQLRQSPIPYQRGTLIQAPGWSEHANTYPSVDVEPLAPEDQHSSPTYPAESISVSPHMAASFGSAYNVGRHIVSPGLSS
ncbi:hypothetical protein AAF712_012827 [Marasmius tenuissimus]|uniref:C2H2-type domain-containing protein n=1 Tax=Marasmius tenuissimus TaxID=585030 RepID=A0ABR2ZHF1_9AGAR